MIWSISDGSFDYTHSVYANLDSGDALGPRSLEELMNLDHLVKLLEAVRAKNVIDQDNDWFKGSITYFDALKKELCEVEAELDSESVCYLEDELGDILWDYLNFLVCLEGEGRIKSSSVFERSMNKYCERISAIQNGVTWNVAKEGHKQRLRAESERELTG